MLGDNALPVEIVSPAGGTRSMVAYVEVTSPSGGVRRSEHELQVPAGRRSRVALAWRADQPGLHRAAVRLFDVTSGRLVAARTDVRLPVRPRWTFTQDRSYYTREEAVRFRARLHRPGPVPARLRVELGSPGRAPLGAELGFVQGQAEGSFPAAGVPQGAHVLRAWLVEGGRAVDSLEVRFTRHPPAAHEVKIDQFTRALLVQGRPFLPVGLYWVRAEALGSLRRMGFNSGDYLYSLRGEEVASLMDSAAAAGVGVLLELTHLIRGRQTPDHAAIQTTVERYRRHPALLVWYIVDEPADAAVPAARLEGICRRIRELDPYHPVYLVNNRPHTYGEYAAASDIVAVDVYPVPLQPLTRVQECVEQARWACLDSKPVWLVAQAFGGVEHWPRPPTPAELRNMVFQGLVRGARGVLFYRLCGEGERRIQPMPLWREVQALAGQLSELAPVLLAQDEPRCPDVGQGIEAALWVHRQEHYLLAVNVTPSPRPLRLPLLDLPPMARAEALTGGPTPRLAAGRLEVEMAPLGAHLYRLEPVGL
ncbi:MAG: hypothetical protein AB1505_11175 [Candidatus Latescibacterota bacterium]